MERCHRSCPASESDNPLGARIQPRSFGTAQPERSQSQPAFHDFSHVDLFSHAPQRKPIQMKLGVGASDDRAGRDRQLDNLPVSLENTSGSDLSSAIMRKGIGSKDLKGSLSIKATANKLGGEESTFSQISRFLHKYEKTSNPRNELRYLQILEALVNDWLAAHGSSQKANSKKKKSLTTLLPKIQNEIGKLGSEQESQYRDKMVNTRNQQHNAKPSGSRFAGITYSGFAEINTESPYFTDARKEAQPYGLTDEELAAIRLYTAGDYKYINAILNKNKGWLEAVALNLSELGDEEKETKWAHPKTKRKVKDEQEGRLTTYQQRLLQIEAMQHTRVALAGLQKLPDHVVDGFRGFGITQAELDQEYQEGNDIVWRGFSSCSTDAGVSTRFAKSGAVGGKIPLLVTLKIKHGKDVAKLSANAKEKETLVLPGATFKVTKAPTTTDGKLFHVTLEQTVSGTMTGVPSNIKPKVAGASGGLDGKES